MRFLLVLTIVVGIWACTNPAQTPEVINQGTESIQEVGEKIPDVASGIQDKVGDFDLDALQQKYETLETEISELQTTLVTKKDQGLEKIDEIQAKLKAAQEAYEETKAALDKLNQAGKDLKEAVTPGE